MNKVQLIGNLGRDPDIRVMSSGDKVASFSVATSERWKDKQTGERKERTQWCNVVIFNQNLVQVVEQYVKKGSKLYVEGQMETRKYTDNSGVDKWATEVVLRPFRGEIELLNSAAGGRPAPDPDSYGTTNTRDGSGDASSRSGGGGGAGRDYGLDDDIPF